MLKCPICERILNKIEKGYRCNNNHHFDTAKEGYTNLVVNYHESQGDNKEMVDARNEFLKLGYYEFLKNTLIDIIQMFPNEKILDAGCGEGYYTNTFQQYFTEVIGIDLSKYAIKKASKNSDATYFINSIQNIALQDESVDCVVSIFSYRHYEEFKRILKKDGYLIEVVPDKNHLMQLKQALYENVYENDEVKENDCFEKIDRINIQDTQILKKEDIIKLFKMTPYYYKTSLKDKEKLEKIEQLEVTFSFVINIYVRR